MLQHNGVDAGSVYQSCIIGHNIDMLTHPDLGQGPSVRPSRLALLVWILNTTGSCLKST